MLEINLLPWRTLARAKRRRQLYWALAIIVVILFFLALYQWCTPKKVIAPVIIANPPKPQHDHEIKKIHFIGYVHQGDRTWALLLFPNGETQEVEVGTQLTIADAIITKITETETIIQTSDHQQHSLPMLH